MSRYAHERRTPNVHRKQRVELEEGNITLRLLGVGVAIAVAAAAFGFVLNNLLEVQTGWQILEAANPETGIAQQFTLSYNLGASGMAATAELKAVTACYTEALEHAYRTLSNVQIDHYTNLRTLNDNPNTPMTVDDTLYRAFETLEAADSRQAYLAPMLEQYTSLFSASSDEAAESYDPARNAAVADFAAEIAAFANDPDMVQVVLLPDGQAELRVAPEYLAYAKENELENFVDLGFLLNAFLCDAAADALAEQGYTNGIVTSFDGFVRVLCADPLELPFYDYTDGTIVELGAAAYHGPAAVVLCRSFPLRAEDRQNYYVYRDGAIRAPYMGSDGLLHAAVSTLTALAPGQSAASLALRTYASYARDTLDEASLQGLSCLITSDGLGITIGDGFVME